MNQFLKKSFLMTLILGFLALLSCSDDESILPQGVYDDGVFIVNEGNFLEGDATISHLSYANENVELNVFDGINGSPLGDVAQSGFAYDTLLFIVVNNSNKVEVMHRYSMESLYTMEAQLPRYMTESNGKGFLTEWVSFSDPGRLSIFDLTTGMMEAQVTVGYGAEDVEVVGNRAYVSNSFGNTISVVDIDAKEVIETITLSSNAPTQMDIDVNGDLWIACKGGFDENFNPANDGAIIKMDLASNAEVNKIAFNANVSGKIAFNAQGDKFYYYIGNNVFMNDVSASAISTEPFIVGDDFVSLYGIGINPVTGGIFLADSKNFLEDGKVYRYASDGTITSSFTVGRGPNGFVFN